MKVINHLRNCLYTFRRVKPNDNQTCENVLLNLHYEHMKNRNIIDVLFMKN